VCNFLFAFSLLRSDAAALLSFPHVGQQVPASLCLPEVAFEAPERLSESRETSYRILCCTLSDALRAPLTIPVGTTYVGQTDVFQFRRYQSGSVPGTFGQKSIEITKLLMH